jgi:phage-related protein
MREIWYYRTLSGRSPVEDFLRALPLKQLEKVGWVLDIVRQMDPVPGAYLKKLSGSDGLWEIRATFGGDAFRLLCFFDEINVVVLLTAFAKKTEGTPLLEIQLAHQRRRDYLSRKAANGG